MNSGQFNLLLADDDPDDRIFFKDALDDLSVEATLTTVNDGVELMNFLNSNSSNLPDLLFLDINMPRKNGFECLTEIKTNTKLKELRVIIYSTSLDKDIANLFYKNGAQYYLRKQGEFSKLKKLINEVLVVSKANPVQPPPEKFILHS
jgi:CheY-like chemotaxis protein